MKPVSRYFLCLVLRWHMIPLVNRVGVQVVLDQEKAKNSLAKDFTSERFFENSLVQELVSEGFYTSLWSK
jgi:hypothetical protein